MYVSLTRKGINWNPSGANIHQEETVKLWLSRENAQIWALILALTFIGHSGSSIPSPLDRGGGGRGGPSSSSVNSNFLNKLKLKNLNGLVKRSSGSQKGIKRMINYQPKTNSTFNNNPSGNSKMLHLTLNSNPLGTNVV